MDYGQMKRYTVQGCGVARIIRAYSPEEAAREYAATEAKWGRTQNKLKAPPTRIEVQEITGHTSSRTGAWHVFEVRACEEVSMGAPTPGGWDTEMHITKKGAGEPGQVSCYRHGMPAAPRDLAALAGA
jgi:hypothetical protein